VPANRPGICSSCHAPRLHPPSECPLCGHQASHITGTSHHLVMGHGLIPGGRAHAIALDVARYKLRGWPHGPVLLELRRLLAVGAS
jgi:hypothetical protein